MPDNPYEPPQAPITDERALALEGTGTFDVMQCFSEAWSDTWANFPLWLGVWIVAVLIYAVSAVLVVGLILVWPVLTFGLVLFYLNMSDQRAEFEDLFAGFRSYGSALVSGLLLFVVMYVISLVGQSVQLAGQLSGSEFLVGIGLLVNLAWTFAVMLRLYFAPLLWVDRDMSPIEAIQTSWEVTRGQTLKLIGLAIASFLVLVVGFIALIVGVIPAMNVSYLAWVSAYRQVVGGPAAEVGTPEPAYG